MKTKKITISKDFSPFPAGRYEKDGPFTGEGFRRNYLVPALKNNDQVEIFLDGTVGYGSSFLEESFGGLIREEGYSIDELNMKLKIVTKRKSVEMSIKEYMEKADECKKNK